MSNKIPKKYQLKTNEYGTLIKKPKNWTYIESINITRRSKHHRFALSADNIYTYEVCEGFSGNKRYGYKPVLKEIIHNDQLPRFWRLVEKSKRMSKKEKEKKKKYKQTKKYKKELYERRKKQQEQEKGYKRIAHIVDLPYDQYTIMLIDGLDDITQAHHSWLTDAYESFKYSVENKGIMYKYIKDRVELDFYSAINIATKAYRRHNYTNYEELLNIGYDKEDARYFAEHI
ncbi:MAG: hypothetical protein ACOCRX_01505 [Candidatus Woesearchaeota archaeon]